MLNQAVSSALAAIALAVVSLSAPILRQAGELKEKDQKDLGSLLAKTLDPAKQDLKDKEKSVADLRKFLEKAGKTKNPKDPLQGGLSLATDLSRALYLSAEYKLAGVKVGQVAQTTMDEKDTKEAKADPITYALWVPKTYRVDVPPYPLILCLPGTKDGKVQNGETFLQDNWIDATLREKVLIAVVNLPEDQASWTEGQTSAGKAGGIKIVLKTMKDLRERFSIDTDRVYLAGREAGVAAAMSLASKFPHRFAGVIGRAGDSGTTPIDNFRGMPTFFAGGGAQAAAFEEKIKAAGYDNCTLKADGTDADVLAWMNEHPRQGNPAKVTLYPGRPIPAKAYWLGVQATDVAGGVAKVDAEIDRAKNTITITGTGIRQVTLFLNDLLVDLDKPVTLVLNGTKQDALLPRSLDDMLDMMLNGVSEPGRVYVVRKDFDLPGAK